MEPTLPHGRHCRGPMRPVAGILPQLLQRRLGAPEGFVEVEPHPVGHGHEPVDLDRPLPDLRAAAVVELDTSGRARSVRFLRAGRPADRSSDRIGSNTDRTAVASGSETVTSMSVVSMTGRPSSRSRALKASSGR